MVNHGNCFSFGAGIEYALEKLSFPGNTRATFASDAQIIQNKCNIPIRSNVSRRIWRPQFGWQLLGQH